MAGHPLITRGGTIYPEASFMKRPADGRQASDYPYKLKTGTNSFLSYTALGNYLNALNQSSNDLFLYVPDGHSVARSKSKTISDLIKGESKMSLSQTALSSLTALASAGQPEKLENSDLNQYKEDVSLPTDIQERINAKLKVEQEKQIDASVDAIIELHNERKAKTAQLVARVQSNRKQIKTDLAQLKKLKRSEAYGHSSKNYVPLLLALGHTVTDKVKKMFGGIPDSFTVLDKDTSKTF